MTLFPSRFMAARLLWLIFDLAGVKITSKVHKVSEISDTFGVYGAIESYRPQSIPQSKWKSYLLLTARSTNLLTLRL